MRSLVDAMIGFVPLLVRYPQNSHNCHSGGKNLQKLIFLAVKALEMRISAACADGAYAQHHLKYDGIVFMGYGDTIGAGSLYKRQ